MKTANFPRAVISAGSLHTFPFSVTEDDWLISITDAGNYDANVAPAFNKILFMHFNDTEKIGEGEIQDEQAEEIADFIKDARARGKNVWVNCHAGICRSGAIVSLLIDLGWEAEKHSLVPGRIPNYLVYSKVRKHFPELGQSWDNPQDSMSDVDREIASWFAVDPEW